MPTNHQKLPCSCRGYDPTDPCGHGDTSEGCPQHDPNYEPDTSDLIEMGYWDQWVRTYNGADSSVKVSPDEQISEKLVPRYIEDLFALGNSTGGRLLRSVTLHHEDGTIVVWATEQEYLDDVRNDPEEV